jgi:hypothetical protein
MVCNSVDEPVGVAFFVSPDVALTVAHNIKDISLGVKVSLCRPGNIKIESTVIKFDEKIDYAYLRVVKGTPEQNFLTIAPIVADNEALLISYGIAAAQEVEGQPAIITHRVHISGLLPPNLFMYDVMAFDGDSSSAIVVGPSGNVIGMHVEHLNRGIKLREAKKLKEADEALEEEFKNNKKKSKKAQPAIEKKMDNLALDAKKKYLRIEDLSSSVTSLVDCVAGFNVGLNLSKLPHYYE